MTPREAQEKYDREWPALNQDLQEAITPQARKKCRQRLSYLSEECRDRHDLHHIAEAPVKDPITQLTEFPRGNKSRITRTQDILVSHYDPTYGPQDPRTETIEFIDFDALLQAMDDFSKEFKS